MWSSKNGKWTIPFKKFSRLSGIRSNFSQQRWAVSTTSFKDFIMKNDK